MLKIFSIDDIPEEVKNANPGLIGKEVYMSVISNPMSINDLIVATVDEIITKDRDEGGVIVNATQHYFDGNLCEECIKRTGHVIYPITGYDRVNTSNGFRHVVSRCDDFGPFMELVRKEELSGKYYANAVFRYRGIFFYLKITGNYLFDDEESLISCVEELDSLNAELTEKGIIIKLFGEQFLITKYHMSVGKELFNNYAQKRMAYEAICRNEGVTPGGGSKVKLKFRRYVLKYN